MGQQIECFTTADAYQTSFHRGGEGPHELPVLVLAKAGFPVSSSLMPATCAAAPSAL